MNDVLNPSLYSRLKAHFGSVKISAQGESFVAILVEDPISKKPKMVIKSPGEYYHVCCPFCSDTRHRLYINHMYGQKDDAGRKMTFLAICYNETSCMSNPDNQAELYDIVTQVGGSLEKAVIRKGVRSSTVAKDVTLPGKCVYLSDLKKNHPARLYLESRYFDPDLLSRVYKVMYCQDSYITAVRSRIVIPVYSKGKLKGWQARYVGELKWKDKSTKRSSLPPKYFSCPGMDRKVLLYNFDTARQYETGVIVEGPTDVWSFGPMAVCTFGATMTDVQRRRFLAVFRSRTAVLVFDPEEFDKTTTRLLVSYFRQNMGKQKFAAVRLPEGTDPGSLDRSFLRDFVKEQAANQGVKVLWRKTK